MDNLPVAAAQSQPWNQIEPSNGIRAPLQRVQESGPNTRLALKHVQAAITRQHQNCVPPQELQEIRSAVPRKRTESH